MHRKTLSAAEQPLDVGQLQLHIGGAAVVALAGMGRGFHLAQERVHLGGVERAPRAHAGMAGERAADRLQFFLERERLIHLGQFVGEIGVKTNQAQVTAEAQKVVADEAAASLQSVSGVNLDEEAANLIRYQQAYMAIAQMIRVADTIFQSVLQATGR